MQKIVINSCYGGFSISPLGQKMFFDLKSLPVFFYKRNYTDNEYIKVPDDKLENYTSHDVYAFNIDKGDSFSDDDRTGLIWCEPDRTDPDLITVVEKLKNKANGACASLDIIEIPDDVKDWEIEDYDGMESVHEVHRSWS